jgi:hypothetical protein
MQISKEASGPDTPGAQHDLLISLRRLPDDELVVRLKSLTARERQATALLVAHLAEFDTRDVYLRAGYSSLFTYCRDFLALSDDEAYNRVVAARTARRFPVVLDLLASGRLNVTIARLLGPHLTAENHLGLLESACGMRKAQVEEIVAGLSPRPDVKASVRKLPPPKAASAAPAASGASARTGARLRRTSGRVLRRRARPRPRRRVHPRCRRLMGRPSLPRF